VNVSFYCIKLKILIEKARFRNINKNNYVNLSTAIPLREDQVNSLLASEKFRKSLHLNDYLE
jgi:hypothetical protein